MIFTSGILMQVMAIAKTSFPGLGTFVYQMYPHTDIQYVNRYADNT